VSPTRLSLPVRTALQAPSRRVPPPSRRMTMLAGVLLALFTVRVALSVTAAPVRDPQVRYFQEGRNLVHEIAGTVPADGGRLKVDTQLGAVRVVKRPGTDVAYRVRVRAHLGPDVQEARRRLDRMVVGASREGDLLSFVGVLPKPEADSRGLGAEFVIEIPESFSEVAVTTGAGDIRCFGAPGKVTLLSRAGAIVARDLNGPLQAETRAGGITVSGMKSGARLITAGGDVSVGPGEGDLFVRTSGGDVSIGRIAGKVEAETGGGSVAIEQAGAGVRVASNGGDILVGDAGGEVAASTGGGGIRVGRAVGGVRCETGAGSIVLNGVNGPMRALTSAGSIRALLDGKLPGDSDLQTWHGDVIVAIPETLPVTIRALVDNPVGRAIESEYPLTVLREAETTGRPLEMGETRIGGGGPLLKLRTLGGRIVIRKVKPGSAMPLAAPAPEARRDEVEPRFE
jgi:hypothetical protein